MKSFDTELKKYAEKVHLKAKERRELRERVLSYMEYHPLPKQTAEPIVRGTLSQPFVYIPLGSRRVQLFGGVLAVIALIVIPLAAERAVPGDVLYLVKTGVNEGIQSTFANTPYEKVTLETRLIERRLAEARLLASEGKLTSDVEAQIVETVQMHADAVQSGIAELRESDAEGAAIAEIVLGSALEVQSAVLTVNDSVEEDSSVEGLLSVVNTVREEVGANPESTVPSFDGLDARVEIETTRAHELFETIKNTATGEEVADIERRMSDINRKIEGATALRADDETGAVAEMIEVLSLGQKLIAFMTDIDVRTALDLESLVPIELTLEERMSALETSLTELTVRRARINEYLAVEINADIAAKATLGAADVDALMTEATAAREASDVDTGEARMAEATALIVDLEKILGVTDGIIPQSEPEETGTTTEETTDDEEGEGTTTPGEDAPVTAE